jgi:hypothetical protein
VLPSSDGSLQLASANAEEPHKTETAAARIIVNFFIVFLLVLIDIL